MRRSCLRLILTSVLGWAMLANAGPAAAASAAALDPGFGNGGLLQFPAEVANKALGAAAQDGSLVVSGGRTAQLLSPTGGTGEVFGGIGSLTLSEASGRTYALGDFAVDAQGRLLVVGSSIYPQDENPSPEREGGTKAFEPAALRILRFLPSGGLDPSFGQGGVVETDLGLPSPRGTDGRALGSHPAVTATGIGLGPQGQIDVIGETVVHLGRACRRNAYAPGVFSAAFVARFGEDGALDPTFGRGGVAGGHRLDELPLAAEAIEEPVVGPTGTVTYRSSAVNPCSRSTSRFGIGQLGATGKARRAFGVKGTMVGTYRALSSAPDGSVVALAETPRRRGESYRARVTEIAPDGKPNSSFGRGGSAMLNLGPSDGSLLSSVTVDGQGRVLIGGVTGIGKARAIVVLRLSALGRQQMSFGQGGRITTRASGLYGPSALFFDGQGRLVSVHLWNNVMKKRGGLIIARYLLSN